MELLKSLFLGMGGALTTLILAIVFQILAIKTGEPGSPNMVFQVLCFISIGWLLFNIFKNIFFGK